MKRGLLILGLGVIAGAASAQSVMYNTYNSLLTENFDTLALSGTANTWTQGSVPLNGWYAVRELGGPDVTTYRASNGGDNAGAIYSFGSTGSTERALGSIASGTPGTLTWGVRITNNTGQKLTQFSLSFVGEQWRNGGNTAAHTWTFGYRIGGAALLPTDTFTPDTNLDFVSPTVGSTATALDGNLAVNQVNKSATVMGLDWQNGTDLWLTWRDPNNTGNDHGMGIDNFAFSAVPEPATMAVLGLGVAALLRRRRK